MSLFRVFTLITVAFLAACTKSVYTDYNQHFAYNEIKTFEIAPTPSSSPISLDDNRIKLALVREMTAKGFVETSHSPDVLLRYRIDPRSESVAYGPSFSFGYGFRNFGIGYDTPLRIEEKHYGQLVVEMIDAKTNQVIWKAVSNRKLTDNMTPSNKNTFINEQIANMFMDFPPGSSKNQ